MAARVEALEAERAMRELQRRFDGDAYCADCGIPSPEYVNLTVGAFICKTCATIHRAISKRRIKDIYTGELTAEDVRRMAQVGGENSACNDRVNRRFLHLWDPREFPQPETGDEERLRDFIWLKYEGSWKKAAQAPPPHPPSQQQDPYSRERELFRNSRSNSGTSQPQPPARANWGERLGHTVPQRQEQLRFSEPAHDHADRFARSPSRDRFHPPPASAYNRRPGSGKRYDRATPSPARYCEDYEDYERRGDRRRESNLRERHSNRGDTRERNRDREREHEREHEHEHDRERGRSRSYRLKKRERHTTDSERDEESEEDVVERRNTRRTMNRRDYEDSVDDSSEADDYSSRKKKLSKQKKREARRKHKRRDTDGTDDDDADSLPSTVGSARLPTAVEPVPAIAPAKAEFDLMSDWMGSNDAATTESATSVTQAQAPAATAGTVPVAPQMPQGPVQPVSMYGGMMGNPAAAYMTAYYPMGVGIPMMPMGMPPMANVVGGMASMSLAPQTQAQALAAQQMQQPMHVQQPMQQQHPMATQQTMHLQAQHLQAQQPVPSLPSSVGATPHAAAFQPPPTMATYQGPAPPPPPTIAAYQGPAPPPPPGPPPA